MATSEPVLLLDVVVKLFVASDGHDHDRLSSIVEPDRDRDLDRDRRSFENDRVK